MSDTEWVVLTQTNGITVAQMYANELNGVGIPAQVTAAGGGNTFGLTVGELGTATLLVPAERLQEARELLELEQPPSEDDLITCPHCKAEIFLDDQEWEQDWFECPSCGERIELQEVEDNE